MRDLIGGSQRRLFRLKFPWTICLFLHSFKKHLEENNRIPNIWQINFYISAEFSANARQTSFHMLRRFGLAILFFQLLLLLPSAVEALSCYACQFQYTNSLEPYRISEDGWCVNDTLLVHPRSDVIRPCAPWEKFCSTTILTILNSFTSISRQCAEQCSRNCESTGYGQDQVSCTDCCEEDNCNNNFSLEYYSAIMGRQYTGWTRPVKNEARFNEKRGLKFPY